MPKNNKILVIRLSALGDIVRNFPVMQAIRAHYAHAHIVFLTTPPFKFIMAESPYFDDIWTIDRWSWRQTFQWLRFAKRLRSQNFLHVYDLQRNDRARIMSYLVPSALRKNWYGKKGSPHIPVFGELRYEDIPAPGHIDTSWLGSSIEKYQLPTHYALLVPGCSPKHLYKRWPVQHYVKTVNNLHAVGIASVLIGSAAEKDVLDDIMRLAPSAINLCGQTNLPEIAELARHAQIAIGNDTGPMHIVGIVGCPVLSLFSGATNPERSKPIGQNVITLQSPDIADIDPASVFEKVNALLNCFSSHVPANN